jgi:EAL domain-containing protein (putative c-di-GMP-specific phosphodiesterase class I)
VYTRSGKLFAAEALVRWEHPERGLLGPGAFVPLAEQTGLILPLGRWVLDRACRKLASWKDDLGLTRLAVNASAEELRSGGYAQVVLDTLARHDVPPTMLTIEVTESALAREYGVVADELRALREAGVRVALDDFGTGYASLAYLKRFPFDHVKIDRMFVADMVNDAYSRSVIETVVALARTLGASVIGEGVESEAQRRMLIDLQCEIAQGFHFCLPLDEEDFEWLLSNRQKLPIGAGT